MYLNSLSLYTLLLTLISFTAQTAAVACPENAWEGKNGQTYQQQVEAAYKDDPFGSPAENVINMEDFAGQMTWNQFIASEVKPVSDRLAIKGFTVLPGEQIANRIHLLDEKVESQFIGKQEGALSAIQEIADALNAQGPMSFLVMDKAIVGIDNRAPNRFKLPLVFALLSHGGVVVRFAKGNYGNSVNYPVEKGDDASKGQLDVGVQGGRTYFSAPKSKANDISDKQHMDETFELAITEPEQLMEAYRVLNNILIDLDGKGYLQLSSPAQTALSALLAVLKAEGIRNWMDGKMNTNDWDRTLVRKSEIAVYNAGLYEAGITEEVYLMYKFGLFGVHTPIYTTKVYKPYGNPPIENSFGGRTVTYKLVDAEFNGYWQRGDTWKPHTDKNERNGLQDDIQTRSGLGVTNDASAILEQEWTAYVTKKNPQLVKKLTKIFGSEGINLSLERAKFMFGDNTPATLDPKVVSQLKDLWPQYLQIIRENALAIHKIMVKKYPAPELPSTVTLMSNADGKRINSKGQLLDKYGNVMKPRGGLAKGKTEFKANKNKFQSGTKNKPGTVKPNNSTRP